MKPQTPSEPKPDIYRLLTLKSAYYYCSWPSSSKAQGKAPMSTHFVHGHVSLTSLEQNKSKHLLMIWKHSRLWFDEF